MTEGDKKMRYYLIEKKDFGCHHGLLFWRSESTGYTEDISEAGHFSKDFALSKNNEDTIAIPINKISWSNILVIIDKSKITQL